MFHEVQNPAYGLLRLPGSLLVHSIPLITLPYCHSTRLGWLVEFRHMILDFFSQRVGKCHAEQGID